MSTNAETRRPVTPAHLAVGFAVVLSLAWVWGHYESHGASDPRNPRDLVTTSAWSVVGQWPFYVRDPGGGRIVWTGLGAGLAITAFVLAVARTVLRRCVGAVGSLPR